MNELDWQARICKALREQGGYARKVDTKNNIGMLDLLVSVPGGGGLAAVEVKYEKDWNSDTTRTIDVTQRQHQEWKDIRDAWGTSYMLVVATVGPRKHYVCHVPHVVDLPLNRREVIVAGYQWIKDGVGSWLT